MRITRRTVLAGGAALGGAAGLFGMGGRVVAQAAVEGAGRSLTTVSDGSLVLPFDLILGGLPEDALAPVIARHGITREALTPPCNLTLLRGDGRVTLFDVGAGPDFQPTAGQILDSLSAAGVAPDDVTDVVFTHGHPDHLWGLLDDFDEPVFPNAAYAMGRVEWDYWTDPATVDTIGAVRQSFAVGAARRLAVIADDMRLLEDGEAVLPGVTARATPGHTPGHLGFEIDLGTAHVMVVGDAIGNHHMAFARPDLATGADQDPDTGIATRVALMDEIAAREMIVAGFHLPDGGIGRALRDGVGYVFEAG
jgi:glyoxylase-like metal-dependent hydrolase (beta-lactamase superfamily II)